MMELQALAPAEDLDGMSGKSWKSSEVETILHTEHTHPLTHTLTHFLPLSPSLEDASDTRRLLTEKDSSHNYGSAPSLSDPATRGERRSLRD